MTDTKALEIAITRARKTKRGLAKYLGISEMALYNKIHNIAEFKSSEIVKSESFLGLSTDETKQIFLTSR